VKSWPGNVHDSKQAVAFLREVLTGLRVAFGRRLPLEFRMDAALFQRDVFRLLTARGCAYTIKVGYWSCLPLKQLAAERQRGRPVAPNVSGFFHEDIPQWDVRVRVMIYRKHVAHGSPRNFQLDLFTPDDGHFEYGAVATNMALDLPALYAFICGRGAQEKTIAELKGGSPSMSSRPATTAPTVPGSSSASSLTTSSEVSSSTRSLPPNLGPGNAPMRI
jgi:hypothetical protein